MGSNAVVTTTQMELTPMRVSYGPSGSLVDLGGTLGNVVITPKYTKSPIHADQSGTTIRDRRVSGLEITVTTELAEIKDKDIWEVVFPSATKVGTGSGSGAAIDFKAAIGQSDQADAKVLVLHPLSYDDSDTSADYTFYKACASAESSITYGPTEQARLKIVWNILPDESTTPERFFRFGDETVI